MKYSISAGRSRDFKDVYSDDESDSDGKLSKAKVDVSSDEESPGGEKRKNFDEELHKKRKSARKIIESDDDTE